MIWGCMTNQGVGYACWVKGRMDADLYITILEDELLQTIDYYNLNHQKVIFQQDNVHIYLARKVQD